MKVKALISAQKMRGISEYARQSTVFVALCLLDPLTTIIPRVGQSSKRQRKSDTVIVEIV